ncbi:MAG: S41 family peptidase [Phycisphaerales bacterium]|nr:S41 family peptidase [Phycisphaerales bacterium]
MTIRQIVAPTLIVLLSLLLVLELPQAIAARDRDYDWYTPVIDVRTLLQDRYVREVDVDAMQQAAIAAMVDSLEDPHSVFIPPRDTEAFEKEMSGRYTGIGAEIRPVDDRLMIITPLDDSPAFHAGLRAGDVLHSIDGTDTLGLGADGCIDLLLGEPGTDVELGIVRPDGSEATITVTRAPIGAPTVEGLIRRDGQWRHWIDETTGVAYVELAQFTDSTSHELRAVLEDHGDNLRGLILDLRGNPGGALPAAVESADLFLAEGPIVHIKPQREDRAAEAHTWSARSGHAGEAVPVVVLVDRHSASASEILAGALAQNGDARVVGERTFGKGSVQELRPLDADKGLVKFTTALYALPEGRIIERDPDDPTAPWGVDPSEGCVVPQTPAQRVERTRAREPWRVIAAQEPALGGPTDAKWMREELKDPALAEAATLISGRLKQGAWPQLPPDEDAAFIPPMEDLDRARNTRTLLLEQLDLIDQEIDRLAEAGIEAPRGFDRLEDDVRLGSMEIVLKDTDGTVIGTWSAADPEVARAALHDATLEKVDGSP